MIPSYILKMFKSNVMHWIIIFIEINQNSSVKFVKQSLSRYNTEDKQAQIRQAIPEIKKETGTTARQAKVEDFKNQKTLTWQKWSGIKNLYTDKK